MIITDDRTVGSHLSSCKASGAPPASNSAPALCRRYTYLLDVLLAANKHVLCVGETGTGKTLTVRCGPCCPLLPRRGCHKVKPTHCCAVNPRR
jgi:hypothetical protein